MLYFTITNAYSWFNYNQSYNVNGTIYPFPMNYSISDLQIKGDVTDITTNSYAASIRFGEETKLKSLGFCKYSINNGRLASLNKKEIDLYGIPETWYTLLYNYDLHGRLVKVQYVDHHRCDDKYDIIYSYDEKGRLKKVDWLNNDNSIRYRWIIEYSTDKNFKICEYGPINGTLDHEYYYVNGLLTRSKSYVINADYTYSYNSQRQLTKKDYGRGDIRTYTYNQKGWDARYNYSSDSKGNWVLKREKGQPGKVYELTERIITYK